MNSKPYSAPIFIIACLIVSHPLALSNLLYSASTSQTMGSQGGTTQTPGWNNAKRDIDNSNSSAMSKQDAYAVFTAFSDFQKNVPPPLLNKISDVSFSSTIGLASGHISISSWWETVGGGIILSAPISNQGTASSQQAASSTQEKNAPDTMQPQGIGGGLTERVLFQSISFTISWPDASVPALAISPITSQTISIGSSITLTSVATHNENELVKHNFEWQLPSGQWAKDMAGFNGTTTVHESGTLSSAPNQEFAATTQNTRIVTFTPRTQGRFVFRFAAADKLAGFGYSQEVAVLVENAAPVQSLENLPSTIYAGSPSFSFTHIASNPTPLPDYQTGFRLLEQREDIHGNIYQPWQELNNHAAEAGNRSWTTTRPAPDRPGRIRYRAYAWNQWMPNHDGNVREYSVEAPNRAPTIAWSVAPASFEYGESVVVRASAQDADNNLSGIYIDLNGIPHRHDGFTGGLTGSASSAFLDSYGMKHHAGSYVYTAVATDGLLTSGAISHTVTVTKATPVGTLSNCGISEGTALTSAHLSASFSNPNDGNSATASGVITYKILSGGNSYFQNGTVITPGIVLPSGTYTIGAMLSSSQNYNEATVSALFSVEANPNADNDGDGLNNVIEAALGLNPNSPAVAAPELLNVNIHTPTLENQ